MQFFNVLINDRPYNYILAILASIIVICLVVAVILIVKTYNLKPIKRKWNLIQFKKKRMRKCQQADILLAQRIYAIHKSYVPIICVSRKPSRSHASETYFWKSSWQQLHCCRRHTPCVHERHEWSKVTPSSRGPVGGAWTCVTNDANLTLRLWCSKYIKVLLQRIALWSVTT